MSSEQIAQLMKRHKLNHHDIIHEVGRSFVLRANKPTYELILLRDYSEGLR